VLGGQATHILLYQVHVQKIVLGAMRRVLIDMLKRLTGCARHLQAATNVTLGCAPFDAIKPAFEAMGGHWLCSNVTILL